MKLNFCSECGGPLESLHERDAGVCSRRVCRDPHIQRQNQQMRENEKSERAAFADRVRHDLEGNFPGLIEPGSDGSFMVVPFNPREIVRTPEERKEAFRAHVAEMAEKAEKQSRLVDGEMLRVEHQIEPKRHDAQLPMINACATCGGRCCIPGGADHAFLTSGFLSWRMLNESDLTADAMIDEYCGRIPEFAYDGSCLFHTEQGCVLPGPIRSTTCNRYLCDGITDVQDQFHPKHPTSVAVATHYGERKRVGVMDRQGNRSETNLELDAET